MRMGVFGVIALGLLTAACGTNTQQRAATGGLAGLAVGALAGGPVGAIIGTAAGAAGGWAMPEGADTLALNAIGREHKVASGALNEAGLGESGQSGNVVREAQGKLQRDGYYKGQIDGVVGPETRQALSAYQQHEGLRQTATLDQPTLQRMNLAGGSSQATARQSNQAASGSTTPSAGMSADDVRSKLETDGYNNVRKVQRQADGAYTAQADRENESYRLRVDAQTGRVISQRRLASNQPTGSSTSAEPTSGSNTSTEPTSGADTSAQGANTSTQPTSGSSTSTSTSTGGSNR